MNWVGIAIIELNKTVRYALRNTGTTARLCLVLATLTMCVGVIAWLAAPR
jgi:hypothetical protein